MREPERDRERTGSGEQQLRRREFLRAALLAGLAAPAVATMLPGCESSEYTDELVAVTFAALLAEQRAVADSVQAAATSTTDPTLAQIEGWLTKSNNINSAVQKAARSATTPELRSSVPTSMQPVLAHLDEIAAGLDFSGAAPQYTAQELLAAVGRANTVLAGETTDTRRALWALVVGLALLRPGATDASLLSMAAAAAAQDTQGAGGQLYDIVFPPLVGAAGHHGPSTFEPMLALLLVLCLLVLIAADSSAAHCPYIFFTNALAVVVLLAMMIYVMGYVAY